MAKKITGLDFDSLDFEVEVYSDGTTTEARIQAADVDGYIGRGVARRRKGERRDPDLGLALAMARAFFDLADGYMKVAEEKLR